ncbi:PREDICTED: protocadherin gamma-B1-like [Chrysochloris asiatica]|uniref:Protocadherin gamma-B1-like n=1 Tax=Chrysochloris asiatica TaxID=185453 RepID=A0A9B0TJ46_CHRAS|nr:PREDICTED: protocadherin gamma-B1-like [Chrysochloris asiatica]
MGNSAKQRSRIQRQVLFPFLLPLFCGTLSEQIRYSIPEEMARGSVVGNLAEDLGLQVQDLLSRNLRVSAEKQYFTVNTENELVLEKPLDREQQSSHLLVLTAMDGGNPVRTGTTEIRIKVTDANDNPPVFSQDEYKVNLRENVPPGTSVLMVTATDLDEGLNAEITYSFKTLRDDIGNMFMLDHQSGEIKSKDLIDFEISSSYTMSIEAKDGGGMAAECKIILDILDENDNAPDVVFTSVSSSVPEDAELGTVIALFKTYDKDSGENGKVTCLIKENVPFRIESSANNYYKLVTEGALDREQTPEYNITIIATDKGEPPLSSSTSVTLHIADVNDNPPVFHQDFYMVQVSENNPPGASIAHVSASDSDLGPNGHISYSIVASDLEPRALSSYASVNSQSGVVFAQRAFDHEQLRAFELTLQARDHGLPALSVNVSVRVLVGDRNDNAPRVLYPALGPDGSALFDTVPLAAQPGYLVTKVVAIDADSGHNAWLSYHVLQASEPGLFSLGFRTGEVRTARALGERDAARQRLLVAVRDGGQPPLSATATLYLVFADNLQEALPDLSNRLTPSDPQAELQFYLVVALALISVLFLLAVILAIALRLRRSSSPTTWGCFQSALCSKTEFGVSANYSEGTLPYSYNLYLASDSGKTKLNLLTKTPEMAPPQDLCKEASLIGEKSREILLTVHVKLGKHRQKLDNHLSDCEATEWRNSGTQQSDFKN